MLENPEAGLLEKRDGVYAPAGPEGVYCDQRSAVGVAPSALVKREGVALMRRGVAAVALAKVFPSPEGVMSHLPLRGVSPI